MAGSSRKDWEDLNITKEEVENLKEALKKEEFRKLLAEYAEEITDPKNRKQYQDEIIQLEAERGVDCTFVNPEPGFVVKTSVDGKKKAFVNICKNSVIGRPSSKPVSKDNTKGLSWSIPFSQAPGREDHDKKHNRCVVYDVVFHPDTLHLAEKSNAFKKMVVDTALNAVEDSYKVKLDKKNVKYPKMNFKGIPFATVIRKKSKKQPVQSEEDIEFQKKMNYPAPPPLNEESKPVVRNFDNSKDDKGKYTIPKYVIKHRSGIDLQEFTYDKNGKINAAIPKELVIEVNLPLLNSTKEVTLDVMEKSIHLISEKPSKYKLDIHLPYAVNEEEGNAKFEKDRRVLIITLPVIKSKMTVSDLMREDSGVESDYNERCTSCDDSSPVGSVFNNKEEIDEPSNKVIPNLIVECENLSKTSDEKEVSKPFRTKEEISFLDSDKQYTLPGFKCNVDGSNLCFVLNVKNVSPDSVDWLKKSNSCHLKFMSIGSGFFPVFYAFLVRFDDECCVKNVSVDLWDNNITVQVMLDGEKAISSYLVGIDDESLIMKDLDCLLQLEKKLDEMKLQSVSELDEGNGEEVEKVIVESASPEEVVISVEPQEVSVNAKKENISGRKECDMKSRTFSESSTDEAALSPVTRKSILKNRICRSLSESNAEDYALGSSIEASEGSDLCIPGDTEEHSGSLKKTVRFNDRIQKQIFRAKSSILGQKKKNQKRSRRNRKNSNSECSNRKTSESENSESEAREKGNRTNSKRTPLIEELEEKKSDDCDIQKAVISEENESGSEESRNEIRFMADKNDKIFEFKSDLIFELDL